MMILVKVVLCLLFVFDGFKYGDADSEGCKTPDWKSGKCLPLKDCKTMSDFIESLPKPIPEEIKYKVNDYYCGVEENVIKICCPSEPIKFDESEERPPLPPDVTGHKNLHLLPKECGLINTSNKISHGVNAELGEFPWMALLIYKSTSGKSFGCGGTVINDRYILTAAHCLSSNSPLIGVRVGEYNLSSKVDCDTNQICSPPVQDLSIEKLIYHPDYNVTYAANDIGLMRVSKIDFKAGNIQPICLPVTEDIRNRNVTEGLVTGWGFLNSNTSANSNILQKVELLSRPISQCLDAYKEEAELKISYRQMCVGGIDFKDSCRGDSGGPLQKPEYIDGEARHVQQGIVSVGHLYCGTKGYPGLFTRVAYYMPWILDNIEP